jgi:hypothetical protein
MEYSKYEGRRKAFVLPLVLVIMLILFALAPAVIEVAANHFLIYSLASKREQLYNAAQSGIEWGKAELWRNRTSLNDEQKIYRGNLKDLAAVKAHGEEIAFDKEILPQLQGKNIKVYVTILDCNYELDELASYSEDLPPAFPSSADISLGVPEGSSAIISPNRIWDERKVLLVRSEAVSEKGKKFALESIVVIER